MNKKSIKLLISFCLIIILGCSKSDKKEDNDWIIADFLLEKSNEISISGLPKLVDSPFGKAVSFDGVDDAIFLDKQPLKNAISFTVEMIFNPSKSNAPFEQRIVHIGEVSGDRMLLEIRAKDNYWYFDGFVASTKNKKALIDEQLKHPLGEWQHVALVVTPNSLATYVNGIKELQSPFVFTPIHTGKTSLGVRLNKKSWFKGSIYRLRITPKALEPNNFISLEKLIE